MVSAEELQEGGEEDPWSAIETDGAQEEGSEGRGEVQVVLVLVDGTPLIRRSHAEILERNVLFQDIISICVVIAVVGDQVGELPVLLTQSPQGSACHGDEAIEPIVLAHSPMIALVTRQMTQRHGKTQTKGKKVRS